MLDKIFDHKSFESNFSFEIEASVRKPDAEPFMILLPPPNVTGSLHIGHSLCFTLQDIVARYKRLRGYDVLFQPGLDHAGIVTQLLVEKRLYQSGVEKGSLTREQLLKEIWIWKDGSANRIVDQLKTLGISCDFSRLRFTMDEDSKKAVSTMFVKLFDDGLLFRGERMVNWDPVIRTAISDLEIQEKEVDGHLWYIKYMLEGSSPDGDSEEYIPVATTRPETLFGDTAVAVNPEDERYEQFIGKNVIVPFCNRAIPVIADEHADPKKGSGAVKITPAHDFNDFEVGKRHKLPIINIMNDRAELNENVPALFQKMDRFEARKSVVEFLEKKNLLIKTENIKHSLPFGDRSGAALEPRITKQWFVNTDKLVTPAIKAVKEGKTKFVPKHWENLFFEWLENIRPWCISRQIWWGHRIPAWYGPDGQIFVAHNSEEAYQKAVKFYGKNQVELKQDDDVLDTWFSSGMWPYITLGWPNETEDLKRYYGKSIVVTGFDIIFFWIARMMMFGIYTTGKSPFEDIYIHGLVRDEKGQKMSKSKGNVIDPLDLCEKYGADSVRFTLASLASPGRNIKLNQQVIESGRNFLTKLWNVVRFAQLNGCVYNKEYDPNTVQNEFCRWIIAKVQEAIKNVEISLDNYRFDEASREIYQCVWNSLCDWYMEFIKAILQREPNLEQPGGYDLEYTLVRREVRDTMGWAIIQFTRMLYPFTPFIEKKLSGELGVFDMEWPDVSNLDFSNDSAIKKVEFLKELISSIRSMKQCMHIPFNEKVTVSIASDDNDFAKFVAANSESLFKMARAEFSAAKPDNSFPMVIGGVVVHVNFSKEIDIEKETQRLHAEIAEMEKMKNGAESRLANEDFLTKAAAEVVEEHKKRIETLTAKIQKFEAIIKGLETVGGKV